MSSQNKTEAEHLAPASLTGLKAVKGETLSQRVYFELRNFLMEGKAEPGQKLTLRQLTEVFGTSPMPIRDAVQRLAAEGALELLSNRMIRVPQMTKGKFLEVRRIRISLEGMAIEEAVQNISAEEIERLESLNVLFKDELQRKENDSEQLFAANKEFHFTIYHAARMPVLEELIENMWLRIGPMLHYSLGIRGRMATSKFAIECHQQMLDGLKRGDAATARKGLEADIMNAGELTLRVGNLPD